MPQLPRQSAPFPAEPASSARCRKSDSPARCASSDIRYRRLPELNRWFALKILHEFWLSRQRDAFQSEHVRRCTAQQELFVLAQIRWTFPVLVDTVNPIPQAPCRNCRRQTANLTGRVTIHR